MWKGLGAEPGDPVLAASVSVNSHELCSAVLEDLVFLESSSPSVSPTPSASSFMWFPELWGAGGRLGGDIWFKAAHACF